MIHTSADTSSSVIICVFFFCLVCSFAGPIGRGSEVLVLHSVIMSSQYFIIIIIIIMQPYAFFLVLELWSSCNLIKTLVSRFGSGCEIGCDVIDTVVDASFDCSAIRVRQLLHLPTECIPCCIKQCWTIMMFNVVVTLTSALLPTSIVKMCMRVYCLNIGFYIF